MSRLKIRARKINVSLAPMELQMGKFHRRFPGYSLAGVCGKSKSTHAVSKIRSMMICVCARVLRSHTLRSLWFFYTVCVATSGILQDCEQGVPFGKERVSGTPRVYVANDKVTEMHLKPFSHEPLTISFH